MSSAVLQGLPSLGVGLGFRSPFRADLFAQPETCDFLEITAEHYFEPSSAKRDELDLLKSRYPLIPHGLSLSLGSAEGLDQWTLTRLAEVVEEVRPSWWSEHVAFTQAGGVEAGHLLPVPRTRTAIKVFVENVKRARDAIPIPLILENITYELTWPHDELDEAAFLGELLDRTDCGLLLDVTNLFTNSINHRFDPLNLLERLPLDRVVQLHFVGGHEENGRLIDSHSRATPEPVWQLLEAVCRATIPKGIILERDENLPPFQELADELARARRLWKSSVTVAGVVP